MPEEPIRELAQRVATVTGLSRRLEELQSNARRRADRIRVSARDAVEIAERMRELSRLRGELASVVTDLAAVAGIRERTAVGSARAPADGVYSGSVEVEVGPLRDFAQLTSFEDAASSIEAASDVQIRNFAGGRATFSMNLAQPVELVRVLEERTPFPFSVRAAGPDGIVLDVGRGDDSRQAA
jgi:hypothetical protein